MITGAGLIMYRRTSRGLEVFLVHPGGPFFKNKDNRVWSFPKGVRDGDPTEDLLALAKREFKEETGFDVPATATFVEIGQAKTSGKVVHIWAFEGDCDPEKVVSNTCMIEWPPRSGKQLEIPEVDRGAFFTTEEAKQKLFGYLEPMIDIFETKIKP